MSLALLIALRIVHVVSGVFWVGASLFLAYFLIPAARAVGPAAGPIMQHVTRRQRISLRLMFASISTLVTGLWLYWIDFGGMMAALSHGALVFALGALFAIGASVIGITVSTPAATRLGALTGALHGAPNAEQVAELQRLQARMGGAAYAATTLLLLATIAMAVARYVP